MSVQSKHILNASTSLVVDSLEGLCAINTQLALDQQNKIVYTKSQDRSKVALMCGGGSGHEPAHAGFVGEGILAAAVCGNVFASPSASQVRRGIDLIDNEKGTVIIVKNYTGDVLNFGLAKEQYAAMHPTKADRVKFVIVGDDVAVGMSQGKIVGRRGLAGTVLVYKIAGALAHRGGSLDEVYSIAQWVAQHIVTIGVSLGHCHVPGTAPLTSDLSFSEIEIGMGIHNESGHRRVSPIPPLSELISQLLEMLTSTTDPDRSFVPFKAQDQVVLLVNNLGGLSELEFGGIVNEAYKTLNARGFIVLRVLAGSFMTSLNMPGFSITLLLLPPRHDTHTLSASHLLSLLDDKSDVPGWKWASRKVPSTDLTQTSFPKEAGFPSSTGTIKASNLEAFSTNITNAARALIDAESEITRMDAIAGDGDCGLTLKAGAEAVLQKVTEGSISGNDVIRSIITIAQIAEEAMGGTSGALYSIFFSAIAQGLQSQSFGDTVTREAWAQALISALNKLYSYTRARPPSRTLVDPLDAFINSFAKNPERDFSIAVKAAQKAAEDTKDLEAKAGRSAYIEANRLKEEQIPDPGAWGVKTILEIIQA